jgi:hypothetical protein
MALTIGEYSLLVLSPLAVDLYGTLVSTYMLHETGLIFFKSYFWSVFLWPFYLFIGKAHLKA